MLERELHELQSCGQSWNINLEEASGDMSHIEENSRDDTSACLCLPRRFPGFACDDFWPWVSFCGGGGGINNRWYRGGGDTMHCLTTPPPPSLCCLTWTVAAPRMQVDQEMAGPQVPLSILEDPRLPWMPCAPINLMDRNCSRSCTRKVGLALSHKLATKPIPTELPPFPCRLRECVALIGSVPSWFGGQISLVPVAAYTYIMAPGPLGCNMSDWKHSKCSK